MAKDKSFFGQVFLQKGKWYAKWPSGKTANGRTAFTVRAVSTEAKAQT